MSAVASIPQLERHHQVITTQHSRRTYHRRTYQAKQAVGWGQRKLLCTEIQFLNLFWDPSVVPHPVLVYAGAAPGYHIACLADMFPEIEFHCYDPRPFKIAGTDRIKLHQGLFTDDEARKWAGRSDVFLVSDIRTADYQVMEEDVNEAAIWSDHLLQQGWLEIIQPQQALLKFRLPYTQAWAKLLESSEGSKYAPIDPQRPQLIQYLHGYCFLQAWAPQTSSETRLVPLKQDGRYQRQLWDPSHYEDLLFHHNSVTREAAVFPSGSSELSLDPPELLADYDSRLEATILADYLYKRNTSIKPEYLKRLSRHITQSINSHSSKGRSLSQLRAAPIKSTNLNARVR